MKSWWKKWKMGHGTQTSQSFDGQSTYGKKDKKDMVIETAGGNINYHSQTSSGSWSTCSVVMGECRSACWYTDARVYFGKSSAKE